MLDKFAAYCFGFSNTLVNKFNFSGQLKFELD